MRIFYSRTPISVRVFLCMHTKFKLIIIFNVTSSFPFSGCYMLVPGTTGVVSLGLPVYTTILMTMVWRAVARVQFFQELWTWTKMCSCLGGVLFAVSDSLIGFNAYYCTIPNSQVRLVWDFLLSNTHLGLCESGLLSTLRCLV